MQETQKLKKHYDHVIIGYNLSSMTLAWELARKNQSFCVLDAKHLGGSPVKWIPTLETQVATRVPFNTVFAAPEDRGNIFGNVETVEGPPATFEKGQFKSFLGFGDSKVESMEAVLPFCATETGHPQLKLEDHWQKILDSTEEHLFLDQQVTDIEYNEDAIQKITLNGKVQLSGRQFYFFEHFDFVFDTMAKEMKKIASQFAKLKWFSSVNLIVHHESKPEAAQINQTYLLMGSKLQACLGCFSEINGQWVSRWESFLPAELTADSETTGAMIKEIKKQIKRAFSSEESSVSHEQILVHEKVYADTEKFSFENGLVSHFGNLRVYSPLFKGPFGWANEIMTGWQAADDAFDATLLNLNSDEALAIQP